MSDNKNLSPILKTFNEKWRLNLSISLLEQSLTHRSLKSLRPDTKDNQRLETLGDAVIDLIVLEWLYHEKAENEGILTKSRAEVVKNETLAEVGKRLNIERILFCAPNYQVQKKDLADAIEAIFGAIFLSQGLRACQKLLISLLGEKMAEALHFEKKSMKKWGTNEYNPKNLLQEHFQKQGLPLPSYKLIRKEGTEHNPIYTYQCKGIVNNIAFHELGVGKTKKIAQKEAAKALYQKLVEKGYII
ncbi:MAG: hypothetical protein EAX86_01175 [Candidatus Heimdallarchaeota archaeon]|nr:hypothetical protein [Candidatus Heimdallarchaeota archaeon]